MQDEAIVKIAEALIYLKNMESYIQINSGDFKNAPSLEGYYSDLHKVFGEKIYIIFNNSKEYEIDKNTKEIEKNYFAILNLYSIASSLENFIDNIDKYSKFIIEILEKLIIEFGINLADESEEEDVSNYDLPYGYTKDEKDQIVVDKKEADMVRRIFLLYNKYKSMKKVATEMGASGFVSRKNERLEFGTVSGILHDERYLDKQLPTFIVPTSLYNKTQEILKRNVKENKVLNPRSGPKFNTAR